MHINLYIKPIEIWQILVCFQKVVADVFPDKETGVWTLITTFGSDNISLNGVAGQEIGSNEGFKKKVAEYKKRPFVHPVKVEIHCPNACQLSYQEEDSNSKLGPLLRYYIPDNQQTNSNQLIVGESLNKYFTIIPKSSVSAVAIQEAQLKGFQFAERVVASLASETAKIASASTTSFEEFVAGVKERTLELEDQFQVKANELEHRFVEKSRILEEDHASKVRQLKELENAHAENVKSFELRNNTAVRRDLLREIRNKIEEQKTIQISPETINKRRIIHITCISTMVLAACFAFALIWKIVQGTGNLDWKFFIPLGTWTILFVTTGIYYIRWNDQWFRDHARVEFENRKFSSDVLRASWVAELLFEWAEKKGITMPPDLLSSFTKNLFEPMAQDGRHHPIDQFNDFLKQVSMIEIGKGSVKVTKKLQTDDDKP